MIALNEALRNVLLDGYDTAFPGGSTLELVAESGKVVATLMLPSGAWTPSVAGKKDLAAPIKAYAVDTGVVRSYRLVSGAFEESGTVSTPDGDGDLTITDVNVLPGTLITVNSFAKVI